MSKYLFCAFDDSIRANGTSTASRKDDNGKTRTIKIDGVCVGDTLADFAELAAKAEAVKLSGKHKDDGVTLSRAASSVAERAKADVLSMGDKGSETAFTMLQKMRAEKLRAAEERAERERAEREAEGAALLDSLLSRNASDPNGMPTVAYLATLAANGNTFAAARLEKERADGSERTLAWAYEAQGVNAYARKLVEQHEAEKASAAETSAEAKTKPRERK